MAKATFSLPQEVVEAAVRLGSQLRTARKRRRLTQDSAAGRIGVSRDVVIKAEQGRPVMAQHLLALLWLYGLLEPTLAGSAPDKDKVGISHEISRMPRRVHTRMSDEF